LFVIYYLFVHNPFSIGLLGYMLLPDFFHQHILPVKNDTVCLQQHTHFASRQNSALGGGCFIFIRMFKLFSLSGQRPGSNSVGQRPTNGRPINNRQAESLQANIIRHHASIIIQRLRPSDIQHKKPLPVY
jgi:hypothetical protein